MRRRAKLILAPFAAKLDRWQRTVAYQSAMLLASTPKMDQRLAALDQLAAVSDEVAAAKQELLKAVGGRSLGGYAEDVLRAFERLEEQLQEFRRDRPLR